MIILSETQARRAMWADAFGMMEYNLSWNSRCTYVLYYLCVGIAW